MLLCGSTGPSRAYRKEQKILDIVGDGPGHSCQPPTGFRAADLQSLPSLAVTNVLRGSQRGAAWPRRTENAEF